MARFLHITFNFAGAPKIDELTPAFNLALDWLRYAPNCWVVWTSSSPEQWYERLRPYLTNNDHMFISTLDLRQGYYGWLPQWAWDWLSKAR